MFLCLNLSSSTEQCMTTGIKYEALIIWQMLHFLWSKWAGLSALYLLNLLLQLCCIIFWHLPVSIHTSLSLTFSYAVEHFQMSRTSGLWSPALLPHSPAKKPLQHPSVVASEQMVKLCSPCWSTLGSEWDPRLDLWGRNFTFGHRCWLDEAEVSSVVALLVSQKSASSWRLCNSHYVSVLTLQSRGMQK